MKEFRHPQGSRATRRRLLLATALLAAGAVRGAPEYQVIDLGTLGGTTSVALAVNDHGDVAGWSQDSSSNQQAFVWSGGTITGLGFLPGGTTSYARAINNLGHITGESFVSGTNKQVYIFSNGVMRNIGTLGGVSGIGRGINNSNEITGWAQTPIGTPLASDPQAFFWTSNQMHHLVPFHSYSSSEGHAINNRGNVAGITAAWTPNLRWWGYIWIDSNGNHSNDNPEMKLLGTFGGLSSIARAVNDAGQVAGSAMTPTEWRRAFLVTPRNGKWKEPESEIVITNALMRDLGSLSGSNGFSDAFGINEAGWVVGYSTSTSQETAFVWRDGVMTDLNSLIPSNSGWYLQLATDINNKNEIVGYGLYAGQTRAFLLTAPTGEMIVHRPGYRYTSSVLSNELNEVWTQTVAQTESLDFIWSSVWSDPPTTYTYVVEYKHPAIESSDWFVAETTFDDTALSIPITNSVVATHSSLWFRVRADY